MKPDIAALRELFNGIKNGKIKYADVTEIRYIDSEGFLHMKTDTLSKLFKRYLNESPFERGKKGSHITLNMRLIQ